MTASPFRAATVVGLAIACAASLVAGFLWSVFGPELSIPPSSTQDAFSRAAVGHKALFETLREVGIPVETSRSRSAAKADRASLLIVAEPNLETKRQGKDALTNLLAAPTPVLVVLPKWVAVPGEPGTDERVAWRGTPEVEAVLHAVDSTLSVERPDHAVSSWRVRVGEGVPDVPRPQLVARSPVVRPLVEAREGGTLAGVVRREGREDVTVVADPDLLENHGLHRGDNAPIMVGIVEAARRGDGPVVFDETLHGHEYDPSVFRELFRWPLVLATGMAIVAAGVWLWSGMGRFGAPLRRAPAAERATRELVARTADLLHRGGHGPHVLTRYLASAVQDVARVTQAPSDVRGAALDEWLTHLEGARNPTRTLVELRTRVSGALAAPRDTRRLVATAGAIHAWRREMTHGAVGGS